MEFLNRHRKKLDWENEEIDGNDNFKYFQNVLVHLITERISIRHITRSKELKSIMNMTLTMMKTVIIPQECSKDKTLTVEITDLK